VSSASHTLFFSQGISAKNVTLGVPRLNEILNVAKNIKTPSVTINIRKADDEEEERVHMRGMCRMKITI
jgi:RNA polymerase Rpb1, domain 5